MYKGSLSANRVFIVQQLLLKAASGEDYEVEFQDVTKLYSSDFNPVLLKTQLQLLQVHIYQWNVDKVTLSFIKDFLLTLPGDNDSLLSEVATLI